MTVLRRSLLLLALAAMPAAALARDTPLGERLSGRILLQVESRGEAWYVHPVDHRRYHLGHAQDAHRIMRELGLGITDADLAKIPRAPEDGIGDTALRRRLSGRILLQIQSGGMAWYVDPRNLRRIPLGRPEDAFRLLQTDGLGITDADLSKIPEGRTGLATVLHDVPFAPQAPFGEWHDMRQQEGCEEASVLMAMKWAAGEPLTFMEARTKILAMSDRQKEEFGYFHDTSVQDTADRLFRGYFRYDGIDVRQDIGVYDIVDALAAGDIVVAAVNGRLVGNPYFSPPAPLRHMIVVTGYDAATDEFVVHDPGTRRGAGLRYSRAAMERSLRDYPSGRYAPIPADMRAAMIVVHRR